MQLIIIIIIITLAVAYLALTFKKKLKKSKNNPECLACHANCKEDEKKSLFKK